MVRCVSDPNFQHQSSPTRLKSLRHRVCRNDSSGDGPGHTETRLGEDHQGGDWISCSGWAIHGQTCCFPDSRLAISRSEQLQQPCWERNRQTNVHMLSPSFFYMLLLSYCRFGFSPRASLASQAISMKCLLRAMP